ncbi:MAG: hypothetical protein FNP40_01460 [Dehalobacter sp. 4CP]|uniref:hypothetical protein n=1 Tax=Dehalobacter sp. CP TaxID=2594474 RepID=UPI0013CDA922|nr:hypothetical protein [Dehalobacter sp. 4CP]
MKMHSKEGQVLVDVSKIWCEGQDLVMKGKLMGAYSMNIHLKPEEAWSILKLLTWGVIRKMPGYMFRGWRKSRQKKD